VFLVDEFLNEQMGSVMTKSVISAEDWSLIVDRIEEGLCVPFLGSGANVVSGPYQKGLPLGGDVSWRIMQMWMDLFDVDLKHVTKVSTHEKIMQSPGFEDLTRLMLFNLARVSMHVEFRHDWARLIKFLKIILPDETSDPSPLLNTLARLPSPGRPTSPPFQLIVTTNYDRLMENALKEYASSQANPNEMKVIIQPIAGFKAAERRRIDKELSEFHGVVIYKIHGSFSENKDEERHSIVITEEDYIKFLLTITNTKQGIPELIKAKLVDSTLLFLGYSLEDWDFRTLFKGLIETLPERKQRKSFAIQRYPSSFWVDFWDSKGVQIRDVDLYEFAEDLGLALGLEDEPRHRALCEVYRLGRFDAISDRRFARQTWPEFARAIVEKSGGDWDDFRARNRIPG
jgi:hypothetical protein